ncbi:DNA-binding protein [Acinetobacter haemolyticus]|uniref:DNA-binding protein n=1 Tax=Acinetobacter haemolyticus TaxID=29430 RepID=UPI003D1A8DC7
MRTPDEVKETLQIRGLSIAEWARENGFSPKQVYQVLNAKHKPTRGKSHQIAFKPSLMAAYTFNFGYLRKHY